MFKKFLVSLCLTSLMLPVFCISGSAQDSSFTNLYNASTCSACYLNGSGQEVASDVIYTTDYITVQPGDTVYFGPCDPDAGGGYFFCFDSSKAFVKAVYFNSALTVADDFGRFVIYSYQIPEGVGKVRVVNRTLVNNSTAVHDIFTVTVNQPLTCKGLLEYWGYAENKNNFYIKHGQILDDEAHPAFKGKSVLFCGDSISFGTQDYGLFYTGGWGGRIGMLNEMEYVNASKGGGVVSNLYQNRIITQVQNNKNGDFDFVILHGGVNDAWKITEASAIDAAVGKVTPEGTTSFDNMTYAGALEELFSYTKECFPNAKLGFVINFQAPSFGNGMVSNMSKYASTAVEACEKWGVAYVNLHDNADFCNNVLKVSTNTYLPDYLHSSAGGYDLIYPLVEEMMVKMTGYVEPAETTDTAAPETTDSTVTTTEAPKTTEPAEKKSGCGASLVGTGAVLGLTATVGALTVKRKKRKSNRH